MNYSALYRKITENKGLICEPVYSELLAMVNEELAKEAEKAAGRKANIRNAAKQFLDNPKTGRQALLHGHRFNMNGNDYIAYVDGFKMCWSSIDFGFGINGEDEYKDLQALNVSAIIDGYKSIKYRPIPITDDFKTALALHLKKYKKSKVYSRTGAGCFVIEIITDNGDTILYSFNPYYLKACLDFTSATEFHVNVDTDAAPVFFFGEDDRNALCLPVRDPGAPVFTIDMRKAA